MRKQKPKRKVIEVLEIENLYNPKFDTLSINEKKAVFEELATCYDLKIMYYKEFEAFGKSNFTAVFVKEDKSEFVFIPGDKLKLGFDFSNRDISQVFNTENLMDVACMEVEFDDDEKEEDEERCLEEKIRDKEFLENFRDYLIESLSKEEERAIHPLLVERSYRKTCWKDAKVEELENTEEYGKLILNFKHSAHHEITLHNEIKLDRKNGEIKVEKYEPITFAELKDRLEKEGYSLPTAREWEYFSGKGCRSLFPWGNNIDFSMKLRHCDYIDENKEIEYTLEKENFFGLFIAFDPYEREIVFENGIFSYKGGDGGRNLCGGYGVVMGYLPVSPYFINHENLEVENEINGRFDFYRRVIRVCTELPASVDTHPTLLSSLKNR